MIKSVYKITNEVNGLIYIGQTKNSLHVRLLQHFSAARRGGDQKIHEGIREFGEENFSIEELYNGEDYNKQEAYYIDYYNSYYPHGYNVIPGGEEPPHMINGKYSTSVLTYDIVTNIIEDLKKCTHIKEVQDKYTMVSPGNINKVNRGAIWKRDGIDYPITNKIGADVCEELIEPIINDILNTSMPLREIGKKYNLCKSTIVNINQGNKPKYYFPDKYTYPLRGQFDLAKSKAQKTCNDYPSEGE